MQTQQTGRSRYQGIVTVEAFKYENARSDFVAITETNEK